MNRILTASFSLVLLLAVFTPVSVMAHDGNGDDVGNTAAEAKEKARHLVEDYKKNAQEKTEALKQKAVQKTDVARQKACTARKPVIQKRLALKISLAEKHKQAFDSVFTKVQDFYNQKGLNVENYDSLVEAVEDAQADTGSKIAALKSVDISLDCTKGDAAERVNTFREALSAARDSFKTYKSSLKELIMAVRDAAKASENGQGAN